MIKPQTCSYVSKDNAGIKRCYSVNFCPLLLNFGVVLASLTSVSSHKKYKKGDLVKLVVIGTRRWSTRRSGVSSKLGYNGVIPVKKDNTPVATRVYGSVYLEARYTGYVRLALVSKNLV